MNKIAFIGGYDKTDLLLYVAKVLSLLNHKVLIIDNTLLQKSRYIVPVITPSPKYVTTYENVDVAVGFKGFEEVKQYLGVVELEYDYVFLDIDSSVYYHMYDIKPGDKQFFVTSFDLYNLRKGLSAFAKLQMPVNVTKVIFTKTMNQEEDQYLNYLAKNLKVVWNNEIVFFPFETSDLNAIYANQRRARISLYGLSNSYVDNIMFLAEEISKDNQADIRRVVKIMKES